MRMVLGRFKGILMLVLLMLVATRLTWLQTSETAVDLSSTFYRTGLWLNENVSRLCHEPPEASFPLPPGMVIKPDFQPPPPNLGELSPGLALVMMARCQVNQLEIEDFAHWNAWLFMTATLFCSLVVRLLTKSWTAGLLAAVAILSRGTVQSRALIASSEPYGIVTLSAAWFFTVAFLRSLWLPWLAATALSWVFSILFVPSLWPSIVYLSIMAAVTALRSPKTAGQWVPRPFDRAHYSSLSKTYSRMTWFSISILGFILSAFLAFGMAKSLPGSVPSASMWHSILKEPSSLLLALRSLKTLPELLGMHTPDIDWHAWLMAGLILLHPFLGGQSRILNRSASVAFAVVCGLQIITSLWQECYFIHTSISARPMIVPAARVMEPLFIAWGTASAWRLIDVFTGYRLSSSGWSIRGRDNIITNS